MAVPNLLSRLISLDLYAGLFTEGCFALTGIEAVPVMLHRLADCADTPRYDLFVPYSWAASLWDLACHSAPDGSAYPYQPFENLLVAGFHPTTKHNAAKAV